MQTRICLNASHMHWVKHGFRSPFFSFGLFKSWGWKSSAPYQEIIRNLDKNLDKEHLQKPADVLRQQCKRRVKLPMLSQGFLILLTSGLRRDATEAPRETAPSISQGNLAMPFRDLALGQSSAWHKSRMISERKQGDGVGDLVRIWYVVVHVLLYIILYIYYYMWCIYIYTPRPKSLYLEILCCMCIACT